MNKKSKWENQSDELRAIIQLKRAENADNNKKKDLKIEIEDDKKIDKKGFNKKSKWENQSDELRAIIQSKRAEKGK